MFDSFQVVLSIRSPLRCVHTSSISIDDLVIKNLVIECLVIYAHTLENLEVRAVTNFCEDDEEEGRGF